MAPARESSPDSEFLYQGDLAQTPLPEILVTIHRYKAPGVVDCSRDGALKRIYLDGGRIIFATTNQVSESVGDRLLAQGRITQAQYDESVRMFRQSGNRHGQTLVEMGILTPGELFAVVRDQIQEIIWSIFAWPDGAVTFRPGREKSMEFVKVDIAVPQAIVQGARRIADARGLIGRLGTKMTVFQRLDPTEKVTLSADEERLLDAVNGKRTLYELVNTPPLPASENAQLLYAFSVLRLIGPREQRAIKVQIRTEGPKQD